MTFDPEQCAVAVAALTPRQKEILRLIAEGMTSKEIAGQLGISTRTEEKHRELIYFKLQIRSSTEATRFCLTAKMV